MTRTYLKYRSRITFLSSILIISWVSLSTRLFQIMVIDREEYRHQGLQQGQIQEALQPVRGNIFDRNGIPLTRNIIHYSVAAQPYKIRDRTTFSQTISANTGRPAGYYQKKLNSSRSFVYLERNLEKGRVAALLEAPPQGLVVERQTSRSYPHTSVISQVLGFTDVDGVALAGLEKEYDSLLRGKPGWVVKQRTGKGASNPKNSFPLKLPVDGSHIQLTIDLNYQTILYEELFRRLEETQARGASGVLINPETGAILAMASVPAFDPHRPAAYDPKYQRVTALTDQFEPGSTFKIVTAVGALSTQVISLRDEFNCENGSYLFAGKRISDWDDFGLLTFPQIMAHSSNVGVIKVAERVGPSLLYRYSRALGFGTPTGIDLAGEIGGTLRKPDQWSEISLAEVALGHEVGVTALQLAGAYAAVANGGFLMQPRLVHQIIDPSSEMVRLDQPEVIRRVASKAVMDTLTAILVQAVENGTGTRARIPGWSIAGKTGTAQKFIEGQYSRQEFISNFAGFFPAEEPQIVGVIILDSPRYGFHWGGIGAAPVFRRVMERIINMDDSIRHRQPPAAPLLAQVLQPTPPLMATRGGKPSWPDGLLGVPDVRGMSLRKARFTLRQTGLKSAFKGSGKVTWQNPAPGTKVTGGSICIMGLE